MISLSWILMLILCMIFTTAPVYGQSAYFNTEPWLPKEKKVITNLHFFLHGNPGTAVRVASSNIEVKVKVNDSSSTTIPFGSIVVIDAPLTTGPDPASELIGNYQGLEVFAVSVQDTASQDTATTVVYTDFGFTKGKFSNSSISLFSRNPTAQKERELAVVGGRGMFRMAKGFALVNIYYIGEAGLILEYNVTVIHYQDDNYNNETTTASSHNNPAAASYAGFQVSNFYLSSLVFLCSCLFLLI